MFAIVVTVIVLSNNQMQQTHIPREVRQWITMSKHGLTTYSWENQ